MNVKIVSLNLFRVRSQTVVRPDKVVFNENFGIFDDWIRFYDFVNGDAMNEIGRHSDNHLKVHWVG